MSRVKTLDIISRYILIIKGKSIFTDYQNLRIAHDIFRTEYFLFENLDNRKLIEYAGAKIYENYDEMIKYRVIIMSLLLQKKIKNLDIDRLISDQFSDKTIICIKLKVDTPRFMTMEKCVDWIQSHRKEMCFYTFSMDTFNDDHTALLDSVITIDNQELQFSYYEKTKSGFDLLSISSKEVAM